MVRSLTFFLLSLSLVYSNLYAANYKNAQHFTVTGRLMDAAGTTPLTGVKTLKFTVLDANQQCVLYEETQALTLTDNGNFAANVGEGTTTALSPALDFFKAFSNNAQAIATVDESNAACNYTSASGEARYLKITVDGTALTPNLKISSAPHALVAETIQGKAPDDFVQINAGVGITQANIQTLTNNGAADALHTHDNTYLKLNTSTNFNVGSSNLYTSGKMYLGTSAAAPAAGSPMLQIYNSGDVAGISVRAHSAQSAPLQQWLNNDGTALATINSSGQFTGDGSQLTGVVSKSGNSSIVNGSDVVGLSIQGHATQTKDLQQWLNASGTAMAKITSAGIITGQRFVASLATVGNTITATADMGVGVMGLSGNSYGVQGGSLSGPSAYFASLSGANTNPTMVIQQTSSGTADLLSVLNTQGTATLAIGSSGTLNQVMQTAPSVSETGYTKMYADSERGVLRVSFNGGAYKNILASPMIHPLASTTVSLGANLGIGDSTVVSDDTTGFPTEGYLKIDDEIVYYNGTTATDFQNVLRAQFGTTEDGHVAGGFSVHDQTIHYLQNVSYGGNHDGLVGISNGTAVANFFSRRLWNRGAGVEGINTSSGAGVYGLNTGTGAGVHGAAASGASGFFQTTSAANTSATIVARNLASSTANLFEAQNGTGGVLFAVTKDGGIKVGINGSQITKSLRGTATWDPAASIQTTAQNTVVVVSGIASGDVCHASLTSLDSSPAGWILTAHYDSSAANRARVTLYNAAAGNVDLPSGDLTVNCFRTAAP